MREKYQGRKIMSICNQCAHFYYYEELDKFCCSSPNAAITEFTFGLSLCEDLNDQGDCFMWIPAPECCCEECQAKKNNQISEAEINELAKTNDIN